MKNRIPLLFLAIFILSTILPTFGQISGEPSRFVQIKEVINGWSDNKHVWVQGEIPVSRTKLSSLERWISEQAPNWTIVLMSSASGQQFDGYYNIDAVEQALGRGLSNQTRFGNLQHSKTGESNGAIFALFLAERKFSYFASDVYDKRYLGEQHWIGQLDRPAIDAMRNGGRIVDAVKNTIKSIDSKLAQKINRETVSRELRKEQARQLPRKVKDRINAISARAAAIRKQNPAFHGPIAYPDESNWIVNLKAIELNLASGEINTATNAAEGIFDSIDKAEQQLDAWEKGKLELFDVENRIETAPKNPDAPRVNGLISKAKSSLTAARKNHLAGEPLFINQLEVARQSIAEAERELQKHLADLETKAAKERTRKITAGSAVGGVFALLMGWLTVLNHRREKVRDQALEELKNWQSNLRDKFNALFSLMDRASIIHRCSDGYRGLTKQLSQDSVREVDELFIMSSATDHVIDQVEHLIQPTNPFTRLHNKFSKRNYTKAVELLNSKSIGFDQQSGLRAILQPKTRALVGNETDYQPFTISFNELIEKYDARESNVAAQLDRLESSIDGLPVAIEQSQSDTNSLTEKLTLITEASEADGFFPLNELQQKLLTTIDQTIASAAETGVHDPVEAMENSVIPAQRQLSDATTLLNIVEQTRSKDFPEVSLLREKLEKNQFTTEWIEEAYDQCGTTIDHLSLSAIEQPITDRIEPLKSKITQIIGRVRNTERLSDQLLNQLPNSIKSSQSRIDSARKDLASTLNIKPEDLLVEEGLTPDDYVNDCQQALSLIRHALNSGNIENAQVEIQNVEKLIGDIDGILALSKSVAHEGSEVAEDIETRLAKVKQQLPEAQQTMHTLATKYQPEVLLFAERFGQPTKGQQTIEHNLTTCETHQSEAEKFLSLAKTSHAQGALILAGGEYDKASNEADFALHQIALIEDQYREVQRFESKNREQYQESLTYLRSLHTKLSDRRTIQSTIESLAPIKKAQNKCASEMEESAIKNPFRTNRDLKAIQVNIAELEDQIERDWEWYRTANTELKGALELIEAGKRIAGIAKKDGITDSKKLQSAIESLYQYEQQTLQWQVYLSGAHRDWQKAYQALINIDTEVTRTYGIIEQEILAAQKAAKLLDQASVAIAQLKNWRNSYRVRIDREAGDHNFARARNELGSGSYPNAIRFAEAAITAAQTALRQAKSRARQERAAEEARRRRQQQAAAAARRRRMSSSSSSGGFSSRSSGSISRPRSMPSSRPSSSRGSSGSGFSRSGW